MTTLVTGASGLLGNNLVRALRQRGERVRAMVRPGDLDTPALQGLGVERVEGDLQNPGSLRAATDGCDVVHHAAAFISVRSGDRQVLYDTNVLGTRRMMQACLDAGVRRVVHVSSIGAMSTPRSERPTTEEDHYDPFEPMMDYERTKALAEPEALRAAVRGLDVCIVNPTALVGPYDFKPSLMGKNMIDFAHGKLPAYIPGSYDFVPVRDVVEGMLLAAEHGRRGERYLLSGEMVTLDQVMQWLSELTGRPEPRIRISPRVMLPIAMTKDFVQRKLFPRHTPLFNEHTIRMLTSGKRGSNVKARRELGLEPTPVRDAFHDAVAWFRDEGRIP